MLYYVLLICDVRLPGHFSASHLQTSNIILDIVTSHLQKFVPLKNGAAGVGDLVGQLANWGDYQGARGADFTRVIGH